MTAKQKSKPLEPDRTPEVNAAIEGTKVYLLECKCELQPDLGDPVVQTGMYLSTLAKTSTTLRQHAEMKKRGVPVWEMYPLDEEKCRALLERAKAGDTNADVVLRRHVCAQVREIRLPPVLAEYVEWALLDETERPRATSFRSRTSAIAWAVARLQIQGYKRHAKPRNGRPNASAFWIVGIALGELIAEGKLRRDIIGVNGTSPANIEKLCASVPYLRGDID